MGPIGLTEKISKSNGLRNCDGVAWFGLHLLRTWFSRLLKILFYCAAM